MLDVQERLTVLTRSLAGAADSPTSSPSPSSPRTLRTSQSLPSHAPPKAVTDDSTRLQVLLAAERRLKGPRADTVSYSLAHTPRSLHFGLPLSFA